MFDERSGARRGPHPALFAVLILPYGAAFGFVAYALPVLAVRNGVGASAIGDLIAATFVVHGVKFAWAPVVDTTLTRKIWYLIAVVLVALGTIAMASMPVTPDGLRPLYLVVMASQIGLTLMGMAIESFMALTVPEDEKGRAAGWYNAGNFAGVGVGGWAALRLTATLHTGWMVGAVLGGVMLLCALPLLAIPSPLHDHARRLWPAMKELGRDFIGLFLGASTLTGLIIALSPVGTGAIQNLFNPTAGTWGIDASFRWEIFGVPIVADDILGLVGGLFGGIISAGGALCGGWLADKMPRRLAYALAGVFLALCSVVMAASPRTPAVFVAFLLIYAAFTGLAFAAFSAFVLETIGHGAVATKYNIFAGFANLSIAYTTHLDTIGLDRWGVGGMLLTDAALIAGGITLLIVLYVALRRRSTSPAA
jgi:MFS family permease